MNTNTMSREEADMFIFENQINYIKGELSQDKIDKLNSISTDILSEETINEIKMLALEVHEKHNMIKGE